MKSALETRLKGRHVPVVIIKRRLRQKDLYVALAEKGRATISAHNPQCIVGTTANWVYSVPEVVFQYVKIQFTEIFCDNTTYYNLRNNNEFFQPRVRSVNNGTESVRFKGPQLWQMLPPTIRNSQSLCQFKTKIQRSNGENCPCKLCRVFIPNLGIL